MFTAGGPACVELRDAPSPGGTRIMKLECITARLKWQAGSLHVSGLCAFLDKARDVVITGV